MINVPWRNKRIVDELDLPLVSDCQTIEDVSLPRASEEAEVANVPLLSLQGITKRFPGVMANDAIDLELKHGEVHAILGENGAGKSTLMKIIYGYYQPDAGTILMNGKETRFRSPQDSIRSGVGMVFQNFTLVPAMTVVENVALFWPDQGMVLNHKTLSARIQEVSDRYALEVDPSARVGSLTMGQRQKVELIKLIIANARLLICDEPTSVLAPHEVEGLFKVFDELKADGYAILFITHKLREVMATADRITVLRHGAVVGTVSPKETTTAELVTMMIGSAPPQAVRVEDNRAEKVATEIALEFNNVTTPSGDQGVSLKQFSFRVSPGEILGIAGVSGNGQEKIGEVLLGLHRKQSGSVILHGRNVEGWSVSAILNAGVGYIPEDAIGMALVPDMRVEENMVLGEIHSFANQNVFLDWGAIRERIDASFSAFPMTMPEPGLEVGTLSGGNMQRVVLNRELTRDPRVLVAYYPTRGLDVKTAEATRALLLKAREAGSATVLISEDLDELFAMSDRLMVMHRGEVVGHSRPADISSHQIGMLMTGHLG